MRRASGGTGRTSTKTMPQTCRRAPLAAAMVSALAAACLTLAFEGGASATDLEPEPGEEITELRTANSLTFAGEDGLLEAEVYAEPINYQQAAGEYEPIDNSLIPSDRPGYAYENAANSYKIYFPEELSEKPVLVETAGESLSYQLDEGAGAPTVQGSEITYPEALPGVELTYNVGATGVEELLEIESPEAEHSFSFDIETSPDLVSDSDGPGASFSNPSAEDLLVFTPPVVYDAAGETDSVALEVSEQGGELEAEVEPDSQWLSEPDREYPITVDPTFKTGAALASRDCRIKKNTTVSMCTNNLRIGSESGLENRSLLHFPVEQAVPLSPASIASATLEARTAARSGGVGTTGIPADVHRVTQSWGSVVTWTKRNASQTWTNPGGSFDSIADDRNTATGDLVGGLESWNVRPMVKKWVGEGPTSAPNRGLILKSPSINFVDLYSSEAGTNAPKLTVSYYSDLGLGLSAPSTTAASYSMKLDWEILPEGTTEFQIERRELLNPGEDNETKTPWLLIDRVDTMPPYTYTDYLLWRGAIYEYRLTALGGGTEVEAEARQIQIPSGFGQVFPRLYSDSSFWNKSIDQQYPAGPPIQEDTTRFEDSQTIVQKSFVSADAVGGFTATGVPKKPQNFNATHSYGMSLAFADPSSQPYVIGCPNGLGTPGYDCNNPVTVSFNLPEYANAEHVDDDGMNEGDIYQGAINDGDDPNAAGVREGWDGKLAVINPTAGQELSIYEGVYRPLIDEWSARSRYTNSSTGTGLVCAATAYNCNGPTVAGFPNMGGVVRPEEIADEKIRHALNITTRSPRAVAVFPATHTGTVGNYLCDKDLIPVGARVWLPDNVVISSGWPPAVQTIARALNEYGAYVNDRGGSVSIQGENDIARGYNVWKEGGKIGGKTGNDAFIPLDSSLDPVFPWDKLKVIAMQENRGPGGTAPNSCPS